jgi:hypothetical protein
MSSDQLLKEASALSQSDLDQFVTKVISLRAKRLAPSLPAREAELLGRINQGIPGPLRQRSDDLTKKRDAENLSRAEHEELKDLTSQIERMEAERVHALAELAGLRKTTLAALMETLGIRAPAYA